MNVIKPKILPRNVWDLCVVLLVASIQLTALFVTPALVVAIALNSDVAGMACAVIIYIVFLLFTVKELKISEQEVQFVRLLGHPKRIPWTEITSVEPASQLELVTKGWLWPLLPAREMTPSLTSMGHYRISFGDRYVYYPPRNEAEFEAMIPKGVALRSNRSSQA